MRRERTPPLQAIGYWSWGADPIQLADASWAAGEREALVRYLRGGLRWRSYLGYSFCRFQCGIPDNQMGSSDLTDGTWVWPEGLSHYIAEHMVALPDAFLDHARAHAFAVPSVAVKSLVPQHVTFDDAVSETIWHEWATEQWRIRKP